MLSYGYEERHFRTAYVQAPVQKAVLAPSSSSCSCSIFPQLIALTIEERPCTLYGSHQQMRQLPLQLRKSSRSNCKSSQVLIMHGPMTGFTQVKAKRPELMCCLLSYCNATLKSGVACLHEFAPRVSFRSSHTCFPFCLYIRFFDTTHLLTEQGLRSVVASVNYVSRAAKVNTAVRRCALLSLTK